MADYLLYLLSLFVLICGTVLYMTRSRWISSLPGYHRLPASFAGDLESGLSSAQFDLSANVAAGDSRAGLDERAKHEIKGIMTSQKVPFDEARRIYTQRRFSKNNIGPDGRPLDPKFVSFD